MLYGSGCAAQHTGRLVTPSAHLRLPFSPRVATAAATVTVRRSRSRSRASPCRFFPLSSRLLTRSDTIRCTNSLLLLARAVSNFFSSNKFSKASFVSSPPDFYGCVFSCLVSRRLLLSFQSHMCTPFLPSPFPFCTRRRTVVRRLTVCPVFCVTAHVVYYCSWLSFRPVFLWQVHV
jgi:hypothetical protein